MRFLAVLLLVAACDQGTKAKPAPPPAPPPADARIMDAEAIDPIERAAPKGDTVLPQMTDVHVRLCNDTQHDITELSYHDINVGRLANGACSSYETTTTSYSYTNVHFTIGKDTFNINPIDYMGETPLSMGHWSYHLTIVDYKNRQADVRAKKEPH